MAHVLCAVILVVRALDGLRGGAAHPWDIFREGFIEETIL